MGLNAENVFGRPMQIGYVVKDIKKEIDNWIRGCRVGPWFYTERLVLVAGSYRGHSYNESELRKLYLQVAMSHCGEMQIEIISPGHEVSNIWSEFLQQGKEGMHHWSGLEADYDERKAEAEARGYVLLQEGQVSRGRASYFVDPGSPGTIFELADLTEERRRSVDGIRDAALHWDGEDPVRTKWPT
jgi:hypothetical protein